MKKTIYFAILSVLFVLCCVFTISNNNLLGIKVKATETEFLDDEETTTEDTTIIEDEESVDETLFENEKLNEFADWIIALIVSFLGSGAFYGLFRAILNETIKTLKDKIVELEEKNKISSEAKVLYEEKINKLENKLNVLLDYIEKKIKIDEEKNKKTNELLSELLPKEVE